MLRGPAHDNSLYDPETTIDKSPSLNPKSVLFKDAQQVQTVTIARISPMGQKIINVCASTGNTSASMAAYAARARIKPLVLIPQGKIAAGKLAQAIVHGAQDSHQLPVCRSADSRHSAKLRCCVA